MIRKESATATPAPAKYRSSGSGKSYRAPKAWARAGADADADARNIIKVAPDRANDVQRQIAIYDSVKEGFDTWQRVHFMCTAR